MDAPPTAADFKAKFPELSETDDDAIEELIALAITVNEQSTDIVLYLAAHFVAVAKEQTGEMDGGSGEVNMDMIGPRQIQYTTMAAQGDAVFFSRSSYGRMYLVLSRRHANRAMSVRVFG